LVRELDDEDLTVRQKANKELAALGEGARAALQRERERTGSLELRLRIELLLRKLPALPVPKGEALRGLRGVELLEWIGDEEAKKVLTTLAQGDLADRLTLEARASLARLKARGSSARK
jgi:hypothetical protein